MSARSRLVPSAALVALVFVSSVCGESPTAPDGGGAKPSLYVGNTEPTASAGGPYAGTEGVAVTFDASASADPESDYPLTYAWDFESDGVVDTTTTDAVVQHVYADEGSGAFTASLTVTDTAGLASLGSATAEVTVANDPPAVSLPAAVSATAGSPVALNGTLADKGVSDGPWSATYDWGDGTTTTTVATSLTAGVSGAHSYARGGSYTVQVTVTDADGGTGSASAAITVASLPLVASAGGPYSGTEGGVVTFDGTASSDPDGDALTYAWDFGDGATGTGATPTHAYADDGSYTVSLTVSDGSGSTGTATAGASIANAPPAVSAGADVTIADGQALSLSASFSDAGAGDGPWGYTVDWGDATASVTGSLASQGALGAAHTYAAPGTYTVTVTVTDKDGAGVSDALVATVTAVKPVARAGGPYSGTEGAAIAFDGSASSDPNGDALSYSWSFGDGATGTGATPSHAYEDNGTYTVTLTVSDAGGASSTATATANVANSPPVVNAGPDAAINEGQTLNVSATFSDAGTADGPWTYSVDWGDGSAATTGSLSSQGAFAVNHPYAAPGTYTATLTVTDESGAGVSDALTVTVAAAKPTARPGGPYTGTEGAAVSFDGSASSDPNGDALAYAWNFGDGSTGTGPAPTHVYRDNGSYTVTLTASDGNGYSATATTTATIANAAPVVNAGADASVDDGATFQLAGTFSDAGTVDNPWTYSVSWGDATANSTGSLAAQGPVAASHVYTTPGTYTATLTVTDKNGAGVSDAVVVTVLAVKPTANAGGPYSGVEGSPVAFNGTASTDPNGDPLTYVWEWGDGTANGTGPTPTHAFRDNGTYTVGLTVTDPTNHSNKVTVQVTVTNAAPVVNAGPDKSVGEAQPPASVALSASFTDAGVADNTWSYTIAWGDGTTTTGTRTTQSAITASKAYATPGTYTVTVTVKDKDNGQGADAAVFTVNALWPTANAGGPYTGGEGFPIAFNGGGSTDPNGDALTYAWDFNGDKATDATGATASYTYADGGSYSARLIVTDPAGHADTATAGVTVTNVVGVVSAGPDASVGLGTTFTLNGSFNDSPSDGPWSYTITWGDGATTYGSASAPGAIVVPHLYAATGTYTATLRLTGNDGGTGTDAATITVGAAVAPVADGNGPYTANEAAYTQFSSAGSSDPNGGTLSYSWNFGDGSPTVTAANPYRAYADNGTYTVTLTVKNSSGITSTYTTTATVANVIPTGTFTTPGSLKEGAEFALSLNGSDVSTVDRASLEYAFDCGDGTGFSAWSATVKSVDCPAVPDQRALTVQGQVRDKDGGARLYSRSYNVTNAAPVVTFQPTSATSVAPGETVSFEGGFTDQGAGDSPWTYTIVWGDGTASETGTGTPGTPIVASHTYAAPGTSSAYMTVKDKDGGSGLSPKTTVTVSNGAPTANANGPYSANEGAAIAFSSAGSGDPDGSTLSYAWAFGDGTTSLLANPSKTYTDDGSFSVRLIVKDPSGVADTAFTTVTTTNVAPTATMSAPFSVAEGTAYTVSLSGTDAGAGDRPTLEYALDCGQGDPFPVWSTTKSVSCPGFGDQSSPVTVRGQVRDKDGAVTAYSKSINVTNAMPTVTLEATTPTSFAVGGSLGVEGSFADKGAGDSPWTYTLSWGDGTASVTDTGTPGAPIVHNHTYLRSGTFYARLTVKDKDGATGYSTSVKVTIAP